MKFLPSFQIQDKALELSVGILARLLAPESVLLSGSRKLSPAEQDAVDAATRLLQPGDIVLTQTPGNTYESLRVFAGHNYDHVAVVIESGKCIQVGPPKARIVPVANFLTIKRKPLVLRPKLSERELEAYLINLKTLVGKPYDYLRVVYVWSVLSVYERVGYVLPIGKSKSPRVICTEAIIYSLPTAERLLQKHKSSLDHGRLGAVSINDIMTLYEKGEMTQVQLPFPYTTYEVYKTTVTSVIFRLAKRQAFNFRLVSKGWNVYTVLRKTKGKRHQPILLALWLLQSYMELMGLPYFSEMQLLMHLFTRVWPRL